MINSENIEIKLLDYLDGSLEAHEMKEIQELLSRDEGLQKKLALFKEMENGLSQIRIIDPSNDFTMAVMDKIRHTSRTSAIHIRNGIILLIVITATVLIGAVLASSGAFDTSSTVRFNDLVQNNYFKFETPTLNIPVKLVVNIIIILNVGLALLILDRGVLRPFFRRRAEMHSPF